MIPKEGRERLGIKPRSRINVETRSGCLYGLAQPDLMQAAGALQNGGTLITNDKALKRLGGIRVVLLDDLIGKR